MTRFTTEVNFMSRYGRILLKHVAQTACNVRTRTLKRFLCFLVCLSMIVFSLSVVAFTKVYNYGNVAPKGETLSDRGRLQFTSQHSLALNRLTPALAAENFFASTKTNPEQTSAAEVTACVVDPALTECEGIGFASFVLLTLDFIFACNIIGNTTVTVFWRNCFSGCSKDPRLNSWEWYFEPVNGGIETKVKKVICPVSGELKISGIQPELKPVLGKSFRNRSDVPGYVKNSIITAEERLRVNRWLKRFVRPNARIAQKVDDFYSRHLAGNSLLGVHVRGTDHWKEAREKKLPPISHWVTNAALIFDSLPKPSKMFIASDNDEIITEFVRQFGQDKVVFTNATRAQRYHGISAHFHPVQLHNQDRHHKALGTQVLLDVLLLAKCDQFLHKESNVASLASYFNPHMKSHFLDDMTPKVDDSDDF